MIFRHYVIWEDSGYTVLARVLGHDGSAVAQADVSAIGYTVAEVSTPATAIASGSLTVASVVFDTLQTDSRWTRDSTGFNFAASMPATTVPTGSQTYLVDYTFTPAIGQQYHFPVFLHTRDLAQS